MAKKSEEMSPSKKVPRESDNPIVEEYKESLLNKPGYGIHPAAVMRRGSADWRGSWQGCKRRCRIWKKGSRR